MDERTRAALVAAVAGGYVLGRTRKARLALTVAAVVMGRDLSPRGLLVEGVRALRAVPGVAALGDQVRGEFYEAARSAVRAAVARRLGGLPGAPGSDAASGEDGDGSEDSEGGGQDRGDGEDRADASDDAAGGTAAPRRKAKGGGPPSGRTRPGS